MAKYLIPKKGKDEFAFILPEQYKELNETYSLGITGRCIGIARNKKLYAIIYKHRCRKYTAFTINPLTYDTMLHLTEMLHYAKEVMAYLDTVTPKEGK